MVTEQSLNKQEACAEVVPIRINSHRLVCENTVYSVFLDHISDTDGREVLEYLNVSPKCISEKLVTGVSVLPVRDGNFGLINVFRHPMGRWSWEAPKGFIDLDESPEQAAIREFREETGFELKANNLQILGSITPEAGLIKARINLYYATLDTNHVFGFVNHELGHGELAFFDPCEIAELIGSGKLEDACTLSLLCLYSIKQKGWPNTDNVRLDYV